MKHILNYFDRFAYCKESPVLEVLVLVWLLEVAQYCPDGDWIGLSLYHMFFMPHKGFSMFFLLGALWCFASVIGCHMLLIYAVGCHPFSLDSWFSGPCRLTRRLLVFHSTSDSSFFALASFSNKAYHPIFVCSGGGPEWQTTFGRIIVGLVLASIRSTAWPRELGVIGYHNAVVSSTYSFLKYHSWIVYAHYHDHYHIFGPVFGKFYITICNYIIFIILIETNDINPRCRVWDPWTHTFSPCNQPLNSPEVAKTSTSATQLKKCKATRRSVVAWPSFPTLTRQWRLKQKADRGVELEP